MQVKVKCPRCNSINELNESNYKYQRKILVDKSFYYVTFFECKKCDRLWCLQVDDDNTIRLLQKEKQILHKVMRLKAQDKKISKKITEDYRKTKTDLDEARKNLKIELNRKQANVFGTRLWFEIRFVEV